MTEPGDDAGEGRVTGPRRRWWGWVAGATVLVLAAGAGVGAVVLRPGSDRPGSRAAAAEPTAGQPAAAVCGVADPDRYTALSTDAPIAEQQTVAELDQVPAALVAAHGRVAALLDDGTVQRWTEDGTALADLTVPGEEGGIALDPDGAVLAADGAGRVGRWAEGDDPDRPDQVWDLDETWNLDEAGAGDGDLIAVVGWTAGRSDVLAVAALSGTDRLALLLADGTVGPDGPRIDLGWYPRFFPQDDGTLVVMSDADAESSLITLTRYAADGTRHGEPITGTLADGGANGRAAALDHPTGVVTMPDDGLLLVGPTWRLVEVGPDGVWRRVTLAGEGQGPTLRLADLTPVVRSGGTVWWASPPDDGRSDGTGSDEGRTTLTRVTDADLDLLLDAPITWDLNHAGTTDRLGFGVGLSTDATDDYVTAPDVPAVHLDLDPRWAHLAGAYQVQYRVTGDRWLDPPVTATEGTVGLPEGGGRVDLDLPDARPGPYQVHAELVEVATGQVRTATCLRYAVGAEGAAYDPDALADGADWGGPGPLRGVQMAAALGVGSHRVQLDVGALVPDPEADPSPGALDLGALPGAAEDDSTAGLAAAAEEAARTGVDLVVQVGQGGEAEHTMVADGTWGDWVRTLAEVLHDAAEDLHLWAPWNEPNNTGFTDGGDYARQVQAPFAAAVRAVDPQALVIGGNALNVAVDWYRQLIDAGGCDSMDVVGLHPYTGFNRSWDEEGTDGPLGQIAALRRVLSDAGCADLPVWDTESGWWSDGPANTYQQADDVARTRLHLTDLGVTGWTYFYSEGGWGEGGFSWSLVQVGSFVKPGALAMATVDRVLSGRPAPERIDTGDPVVHALAYGPVDDQPGDADPATGSLADPRATAGTPIGADQDLVAVWTEDAVTTVQVIADRTGTVTVTDLYGGSRTLDVTAGRPAELPVSGAPVYLTAPTDLDLTVAGTDRGPDLLAGGTVTASSTGDGGDLDLLVTADGAQSTGWQAGTRTDDGPDTSPWVQVDLPEPATVDRVQVVSAGIRCCTAGVRAYQVSIRTPDGDWQQVGRQDGLFWERTSAVTFDPVTATAVRVQVPATTTRGVRVPDLVYSGQNGGLLPAWEPVRDEPTWPLTLLSVSATGPAG